MTYPITVTDWNEGASPGISAAQLDRIEQGILDAHESVVEGKQQHVGKILTGTYSSVSPIGLTVPASWVTYKFLMRVSWVGRQGAGGGSGFREYDVKTVHRTAIGGETLNGLEMTDMVIHPEGSSNSESGDVGGIMTMGVGYTDVDQTIEGRFYVKGSGELDEINIYAEARRIS